MERKNEILRELLRELSELDNEERDWAYRFKDYEDPPFEYGVGLDDPEVDYWVIPAFAGRPTRVLGRHKLPRDEDGPTERWGTWIWDEDLVYLGNFLALWAEGDPTVRLIVRRIGALLLEEKMPHLRAVGKRIHQNRGGQGVVFRLGLAQMPTVLTGLPPSCHGRAFGVNGGSPHIYLVPPLPPQSLCRFP